ncbi:type II and III secretion system protein family protein [Aureimonas phyllosphaerae]|uniref:Pilus assembly protein CpaC n=1 Tax=Aureimonas phyllosphaerae TaxID=1166078 RepID=A0A7W6BLB8_9HYPH|nr:type II and III secretion system protein family protein [Aureimonas phyllosphaerae]MBB3933981.1 pilus assembly protein CpaC [Aureimonas phyllosphaerae]MBB3958803.1 pilus assembly protein CpaC [Aureimonas phyllosphaerae]SFF19600.1 pilus assembly protein CpaC [Aureimonas phyllosphaerae]
MATRILRPLAHLALAVTAAGLPEMAVAASNDAIISVTRLNQSVPLGLNKSKVIDLPRDAHDIVVADPSVADAVTRTARRIYLFGKRVGQTNIFVFDAAGREIAVLDLRIERDIAGLAATIRRFIPTADVKAEMLNDNVILTGTVENAQDAARAVDLATIYTRGGEATTGQFVQTATSSSGSGTNSFNSVSQISPSLQRSQIVNLLQIQGEDQVTLKVTVAEVQRSVVKQLGLSGSIGGTSDGVSFFGGVDNPFALGKALSTSGIAAAGAVGDVNFDAMLSAMEQAGVMRTLAEPSLTAISGESASFKVGGEFSVPTGQSYSYGEPERREFKGYDGSGQPIYETIPATRDQRTIRSKEIDYGIGLDFTPVVLSPGRISLKIRTAVSEPTFESPLNIPGGRDGGVGSVGIRKRLADTTVELPSGGSMVIAGLVRDEMRQVISGYPGLSKIPVLGTLFRSRDFQRYETELVVIVTPYLVRPVARQDLARPDDNLAFTSDGSGNLLGRINRVYGQSETALPSGRYHGTVGYIYK